MYIYFHFLQGIKDPKRGLNQTVTLPIQMANLHAYNEAEMLIVESPKGLTVACNTVYQICQIRVSGVFNILLILIFFKSMIFE